MPYPYIDQTHVEKRLSKLTVKQIYDDQNEGEADDDPIAQLCADASSKVAGYLRGIYSLDAVATTTPHEVIRLATDVAEAYAARRFPSYVRGDWKELMKAAKDDLLDLRKGVTRLDVVGTPEPAKNEGGTVRSGDPASPAPTEKLFANGTGDF